jgi:hypothetical protein
MYMFLSKHVILHKRKHGKDYPKNLKTILQDARKKRYVDGKPRKLSQDHR